jgi:type IV pilus assembly protein PilC
LELGDQLGEAFARFGILDASSRKLILVAEEQGALPETFREQSKFYGRRWTRRKEFVFSMAEPMFMLCLGAFYFRRIFGKIVEATMSKDTWSIMKGAAISATLESLLFVAITSLILYAWLNFPIDSSLRDALGRIWYRLPFVSKPQRLQAVANFCRYFRQSVRAGMDVYRSFELAAEASGSPTFMEQVGNAIHALEQGFPMDQAFAALKDMPDEVIDYIGIGEETGRVDEQLAFLAKRYDKLTDEAAQRQIAARMYIVRLLFIVGIMVLAVFKTVLKGGGLPLF